MSESMQEQTGEPTRERSPMYERYKIETHHTPPRRKQPHPFIPRVSKTVLASMLFHEAFEYGFKLTRKEYRHTLLSRPCIYGVFSGPFGGFHPIREKCTGCMRCVQEFPSMCKVDRNPEFYNFADSYWAPKDPNIATNPPARRRFRSKLKQARFRSEEWGTREHSRVKVGIPCGPTCLRSFAQHETASTGESTSQPWWTLEGSKSSWISRIKQIHRPRPLRSLYP